MKCSACCRAYRSLAGINELRINFKSTFRKRYLVIPVKDIVAIGTVRLYECITCAFVCAGVVEDIIPDVCRSCCESSDVRELLALQDPPFSPFPLLLLRDPSDCCHHPVSESPAH